MIPEERWRETWRQARRALDDMKVAAIAACQKHGEQQETCPVCTAYDRAQQLMNQLAEACFALEAKYGDEQHRRTMSEAHAEHLDNALKIARRNTI